MEEKNNKFKTTNTEKTEAFFYHFQNTKFCMSKHTKIIFWTYKKKMDKKKTSLNFTLFTIWNEYE